LITSEVNLPFGEKGVNLILWSHQQFELKSTAYALKGSSIERVLNRISWNTVTDTDLLDLVHCTHKLWWCRSAPWMASASEAPTASACFGSWRHTI